MVADKVVLLPLNTTTLLAFGLIPCEDYERETFTSSRREPHRVSLGMSVARRDFARCDGSRYRIRRTGVVALSVARFSRSRGYNGLPPPAVRARRLTPYEWISMRYSRYLSSC